MDSHSSHIPAAINISQMARFLNLSRSRFYQLLNQNILLPPIYSVDTKRPFYTREMAEKNLAVKMNNVGINGRVILFYTPKVDFVQKCTRQRRHKTKAQTKPENADYAELIEGLESLGMEEISASQIQSALAHCFPNGTDDVGYDEMLTAVFRHLKCRNTTDNVRR